ncbi:MAG: thiamine diphosphokinase [Candidatus Symbiothrix sp.]|nr:thiamine diphosphokinase [Candidatus Symbiothrix sp.]
MIPLIQCFKTVILADGDFPVHRHPLVCLQQAERIICCDGAAEKLLQAGIKPAYIVGDMDSLSEELKHRFESLLYRIPEQETNDLTKSVHFCLNHGWNEITVLGATGNREDHTLGNLSLLADYAENASVQMLTDYGVFTAHFASESYQSFSGQQVSIFSLTPETRFTTENLLYPLNNRVLTSWWQGSLNESVANCFSIRIDDGRILVFREYDY